MTTRMRPELLRQLAETTGGRFLPVSSAADERTAVSMLRSRSAAEESVESIPMSQPLHAPLSLLALALLLGEAFAERAARVRVEFRNALATSKFPRKAAWGALLLLAMLNLGASGDSETLSRYEMASAYNSGVSAYAAGDHDAAIAAFSIVEQQAAGELKSKAAFNLANSWYERVRQGKLSRDAALTHLQSAMKVYREAIQEKERAEDARVNLELTYRLWKQIRDQSVSDSSSSSGNNQNDNDASDSNVNEPGNSGNRSGSQQESQQGNQHSPNPGKQPDSSNESGQNDVKKPADEDTSSDNNGSNGGRTEEGERAAIPPPLTDKEAEDELNQVRANARYREGRSSRPPQNVADLFPW